MYALLSFVSALSLLALAYALRDSISGLIWWSVSASLLLAAHYFGVFIVIAEAGWLLYKVGIRRRTVAATSVTMFAALALVPLAVHQSDQAGGLLSTSLLSRVAQVPVQLLVGYGVTATSAGKAALAVASLLLCFAALLLVTAAPLDQRRAAAWLGDAVFRR